MVQVPGRVGVMLLGCDGCGSVGGVGWLVGDCWMVGVGVHHTGGVFLRKICSA
jgi:hypothetical protein